MNNPYDENYVFTDEEIQEMLQRDLEQYKTTVGSLTPYERRLLLEWVAGGNSVNDNPYGLYGDNGSPMDFIAARRAYPEFVAYYKKTVGNASHDACYPTRRQRRAAVKQVISRLSSIRDAEQKSLDNVPENLQGSDSYEAGELAVDALDEILDLLAQVY